MGVFHVFESVQIVSNRAKRLKYVCNSYSSTLKAIAKESFNGVHFRGEF